MVFVFLALFYLLLHTWRRRTILHVEPSSVIFTHMICVAFNEKSPIYVRTPLLPFWLLFCSVGRVNLIYTFKHSALFNRILKSCPFSTVSLKPFFGERKIRNVLCSLCLKLNCWLTDSSACASIFIWYDREQTTVHCNQIKFSHGVKRVGGAKGMERNARSREKEEEKQIGLHEIRVV